MLVSLPDLSWISLIQRKVFFATPQRSNDSSWSNLLLKILFELRDIPLRDDLLKLSWTETAAAVEDVSRRFTAVATEYRALSIYEETNSLEDDGNDEIVSSTTILSRPLSIHPGSRQDRSHFKNAK